MPFRSSVMIALGPRRASALVTALVLAAAAAAGCDDGGPTATTNAVSPTGTAITVDPASNLQIAVVGHTIRVNVVATNTTGASVAGLAAVWTVAAGRGTLSATSTTVGASGRTGVDWTLGTQAGVNTLSVSIDGAVATITATGAPDGLVALAKVTQDPQIIAPGASTPMVVRAIDQFGNAISGIVVTWTASGGGTLAPTTTTTGRGGNAQVSFTTGPGRATYSITATTAGLAPVTFTLTGR